MVLKYKLALMALIGFKYCVHVMLLLVSRLPLFVSKRNEKAVFVYATHLINREIVQVSVKHCVWYNCMSA